MSTLASFSDEIADLVERTGPGIVALQARRSYPASGVVIDAGVVVTAAHTLRREDGITAVLPDGSTTSASVVGVDTGTDLAVLRIDSSQGTPVTFGDAAGVRAGNYVVAISRGTDGALAASGGLIATTGGEWRTWRGGHIDRRIQLDGGLWAGFSGGPIVDSRGAVIGIGTSALSRARAVVVPGSTLKRVTEQLVASGRVSHAYIGAAVQPVEIPAALRSQLKANGTDASVGLIVMSTVPQGPADAAGITLGDTLLTIDGKSLSDVDDLRAALSADRIGQAVKVTLIRGGQLITAEVTVSERPRGRC